MSHDKDLRKNITRDAVLQRIDQLLSADLPGFSDLEVEYRSLAESYRKLHHQLHKTLIISDSYQEQTKELALKLDQSAANFQKLKEVALPICMICHKIHTSSDYWEKLEDYFSKQVDINFSHGICPECIKVTYGKLGEQALARKKSVVPEKVEQKSKEHQDDAALLEMRALLETVSATDDPLAPEIQKIVNRYTKLLRRFDKIVNLGDSYQSQLREFNLRLELMAHTDPLTGINNRGYFMELLHAEMERDRRYGHTFSVLMFDLDHFKTVNDTWGHAAGDEALRTMARVLQSSGLRKSDFFGRIGGEEFAVALPETALEGALEVAERIRATVGHSVIIYGKNEIFITTSIGVSQYRHDDTLETLLQRADHAMYEAKQTGRNRVCPEP